MNDSQIKTITELRKFLQSAGRMSFERLSQTEAYEWIKKALKRFKYFQLKKLEKGSVQDYIKHLTRYSPSQITRLIASFFETEDIQPLKGKRNKFPVKYLPEELQLLAQTNELHGDKNGVQVVYHINTIDEITQFEFIAAIKQITQDILIPILKELIDSDPFKILGFHADNGSEYFNYHRPCAFSSVKKDSKDKIKKIYPFQNYKTPYEKFKSLPHSSRFLKHGLSFNALDKQYLCKNPNQQAEFVQQQRDLLFKKINSR